MRQSPRGPDEPSVEAWYVLGGGPVGEQVARRLADIGLRVRYVDDSHESSVVPSHEADPTDVRGLETTGIGPASTVVVATRHDRRNLLVAQLVRVHFDPDRIIVLANRPSSVRLFEEAGHESVCAATVLSTGVAEAL
ncbi:NAD-binding protein [Haloarchaeobius sp. FL176]|uniref:NAD-binding protein n=1 Tax=Haloarchaeobius sp. FL176 TaxID=2967129 RepID=UPI002148D6CC|nr:NAD-binding protein [Haloarchaeobius sp. FL176]